MVTICLRSILCTCKDLQGCSWFTQFGGFIYTINVELVQIDCVFVSWSVLQSHSALFQWDMRKLQNHRHVFCRWYQGERVILYLFKDTDFCHTQNLVPLLSWHGSLLLTKDCAWNVLGCRRRENKTEQLRNFKNFNRPLSPSTSKRSASTWK